MKKSSGITLIALIITIIVLLILAGVSLSLALGNNGVLTRASESVMADERGTVSQELQMVIADASTEYLVETAGGNLKYRKSIPYFRITDSEGNVTYGTRDTDIFMNNCSNAITVILDDSNPVVVNEAGEVVSGGNDTGILKGYYQAKRSKLFYPFSILLDTGKIILSKKGFETIDVNSPVVAAGLDIKEAKVHDNVLYMITTTGDLYSIATRTAPTENSYVVADENTISLRGSNVKGFIGLSYEGFYETFDNSVYNFDNEKVAENVKEFGLKYNFESDNSVNLVYDEGYINFNNELHEYYTNNLIASNVQKIINLSYYLTLENDLIRFKDGEKIASNVKDVDALFTKDDMGRTLVYRCYITNSNDYYRFDGTLVASNVKEFDSYGYYLTNDNVFYKYGEGVLANNVKQFGFVGYDNTLRGDILYYVTSNGEFHIKINSQDQIKATNVDTFMSYETGYIYRTNNNKYFNIETGDEISASDVEEYFSNDFEDLDTRQWYESDGKIYYWYTAVLGR